MKNNKLDLKNYWMIFISIKGKRKINEDKI